MKLQQTNHLTVLIILTVLLSNKINGAHILCLMGVALRSNHLWSNILFQSLAARGHQLTVVTTDIPNEPAPNTSYIHLESTYDTMQRHNPDFQSTTFAMRGSFKNMLLWYETQLANCKGILASHGYRDAIELATKQRRHFDLIIYDTTYGTGCLSNLAQNWPKSPIVGISGFKVSPEVFEVARGGRSNPALVPYFTTSFDEQMSYWQRCYNTLLYGVSHVFKHVVIYPVIGTMLAQNSYNRENKVSSYEEDLKERIKIILVNTHPAIDSAQSLPPNVIPVGGLHLAPAQPLSEDILRFIDGSKKGVIYMSLGTSFRIEMLGQQRIDVILKVVRRLSNYNFIWKVENVSLIKDQPKNLYLSAWLPQNDILAHAKVRAFFTQASGISIQEAVYHAVPIIALPLQMDQHNNAQRICARGAGIQLQFSEFNEVSLLSALSEVLDKPVFRQNVQKLQMAFCNQPELPLKTATWWVEQVLTQPQVFDHLALEGGAKVGFFVSHSFDVLTLGIAFIAALCINFFIIFRQILQSILKQKTQKETTKTIKKEKRSPTKKIKVKKN